MQFIIRVINTHYPKPYLWWADFLFVLGIVSIVLAVPEGSYPRLVSAEALGRFGFICTTIFGFSYGYCQVDAKSFHANYINWMLSRNLVPVALTFLLTLVLAIVGFVEANSLLIFPMTALIGTAFLEVYAWCIYLLYRFLRLIFVGNEVKG